MSTCWTLIRGAAAGHPEDRDLFVRRYRGVVAAYMGARWRAPSQRGDIDDAVQEVFLECFKEGGALGRARSDGPGGFRAFLFGVVRNVAARAERRNGQRRAEEIRTSLEERESELHTDDLSSVFEAAWARAMLVQAAETLSRRATAAGGDARRRVEMLELRFQEGLPIRKIAGRWGIPADRAHKLYERARAEFREVLLETVAFENPGSGPMIDEECRRLLEILA